jgi:TPP-dependent pyruvate/acetoin dehydrogenase alpha subunit
MLEAMLESSLLDERLLRFQRQGRIGFYLTAWGEEATLIGPTWALRPPTGSSRATASRRRRFSAAIPCAP